MVTFNDYGTDIKKNVEVVLDTSDIKVERSAGFPCRTWLLVSCFFQEFGRATANLRFESFDGGRDSRERMTQVTMNTIGF